MRRTTIALAAAIASLGAATVTATPPPNSPKGHGPTIHSTPAPATHGSPQTTHGGPKTTGGPKAAGGTKTPTHTATTTPLNPIARKIASTPGLSKKMPALLPNGMTLNQASMGFKNQGQFIAALHVSRNLGIPFADLKTAMTGPQRLSLGQAIQKLRPSADSRTATERAEHQAAADVRK